MKRDPFSFLWKTCKRPFMFFIDTNEPYPGRDYYQSFEYRGILGDQFFNYLGIV